MQYRCSAVRTKTKQGSADTQTDARISTYTFSVQLNIYIYGYSMPSSEDIPRHSDEDAETLRRGLGHFYSFQCIVNDMKVYYSHLLSSQEHEVIDKMDGLSGPSKILFVRIFDRNYKNNQYMSSKLSHYLPEQDFGQALDELCSAGFISITTQATLDAFEQLNGEQRGKILQQFKLSTSGNKNEQIIRIQKHLENSKRQTVINNNDTSTLHKIVVRSIEEVHGGSHFIEPFINNLFLLLYRLYYLDASLDEDGYKRHYLSRTGVYRFPDYTIDRGCWMLFENRGQADEYFSCLETYLLWEVRNGNDGPWTALTKEELAFYIENVLRECEPICRSDYTKPSYPEYLLRYTADRVRIRTLLRVREAMATPKGRNPQIERKIIDVFLSQKHYCLNKRPETFARKIELIRAQVRKAFIEDSEKLLYELRDTCEAAVEEYDATIPDSLDVLGKLKPVTALLSKHKILFSWDVKALDPNIQLPEEHIITGEKFKELTESTSQDEIRIDPTTTKLQQQPKKRTKLHPSQSSIHKFFNMSKKPEQNNPPSETENKVVIEEEVPIPARADWITPAKKRITVEEVALMHYSELGYRGWHCEGKTIRTVCTLLFYDVIFSPIPGVFYNSCQTAPLDMVYGEEFYSNRKQLIDSRLAQLSDVTRILEILEANYTAYCDFPPIVDGVKWNDKELTCQENLESNFKLIVKYLGAEVIRELCKRFFLNNVRNSGLPDLFMINDDLKTCLFAEVKSINDTLSNTQKHWLDFFTKTGVSVHISRVLSREEYSERQEKLTRKEERVKKKVQQEQQKPIKQRKTTRKKRKVEVTVVPDDEASVEELIQEAKSN